MEGGLPEWEKNVGYYADARYSLCKVVGREEEENEEMEEDVGRIAGNSNGADVCAGGWIGSEGGRNAEGG